LWIMIPSPQQDLGTQTLKGIDTPVQVSQVVGESAAQSRLDVAGTSGLTPLVGREAERVPFFWNDTSNPSILLPLYSVWLSAFASRNQL
jgi:hypothetical protein